MRLNTVEPRMAKASLDRQSLSIDLMAVVKEALMRRYGSLKAAAITFGMDQGQLTRELQSGDFKLKRLEHDEELKTALARGMQDAYANPISPQARVRDAIRDIRRRCDEVEQYLEFIA
jgi:hypothetical protein